MKSVLYLGCPPAERGATAKLLAEGNLSVVWVDTVPHALAELRKCDMPVLLDLSHDVATLQSARDLRTASTSTLMFAVVDPRRPELTTEAVLTGVADVFARPPAGARVAQAILREQTILREPDRRPHTPDEIGGKPTAAPYAYSQAMQDVMAQVARAATLRSGVLIRGEDGTGRQLVAETIHFAQSPARGASLDASPDTPAGAFVSMDCAHFEGEQLDAELFGSAPQSRAGEGTATGLDRVGRNARLFLARHGTLFLRNVSEAPARLQSRLVRVLRDQEAVLAETGEAIPLDVRPITAVGAGFESAAADGHINADLFRRLSAVRIDMPPLRQRREDIPALANYFVRDICASLGVPAKTLSRSALSLAAALPWRGNAAELRALLEAIVGGLQDGCGIGLDAVLAHVRLDGGEIVPSTGKTLRQARASFEREYIVSVLEHHNGRISEAASVLGLQRTNLYRKLRSLRVSRGRGPRRSQR